MFARGDRVVRRIIQDDGIVEEPVITGWREIIVIVVWALFRRRGNNLLFYIVIFLEINFFYKVHQVVKIIWTNFIDIGTYKKQIIYII